MSAASDLEKDFLSPGFTLSKAPGPIGGPGAWFGPDMTSRREEWTYTLSDSDIGELDDAMAARGTSIGATLGLSSALGAAVQADTAGGPSVLGDVAGARSASGAGARVS